MWPNADRFDPLIAESAARWGPRFGVVVPVPVVKGIIGKESSFNPAAVRRESDGRISRGLMQVLEGTARDLGLSQPTRLHEPAVGIDFGVKYLAQQLARYRGNVPAAVAAYNAGTARVDAGGRFRNQSYVDHVLEHARGFAGAVALPAALGLGIFVLWWLRRRRA